MDTDTIKNLNSLIERALMVEHFDDGEYLKELAFVCQLKYNHYMSCLYLAIIDNPNKIIIPNEFRQLEDNLGRLENAIEDLKPKTLRPDSKCQLERGKALSMALSGSCNAYIEDIKRAREERHETIIAEQEEPKHR